MKGTTFWMAAALLARYTAAYSVPAKHRDAWPVDTD